MESMKFTPRRPPEWPPQRVWREVDNAAQVWDDLHEHGCEVHFDLDENSGRLAIEMRDLEGNVLKTLSPSGALGIAATGRARGLQ
jgi:flagellar protein FlaG